MTPLLAALLYAAAAGSARAVIVGGTSNGTLNSTAPAGLSYWNNIGHVPFGNDTGGSGIYLGGSNGEHWVLTAHHVEGGVATSFPFVMNRNTAADDAAGNSITFNSVAGSQRVLSFQNKPSDISVFKIQATAASLPYLQSLPKIQFGPQVGLGTQVTMVGEGRDRKPGVTTWDLANPNNPQNTKWTVTTNASLVDRTGFYYNNAPSFSKIWATNAVEKADPSSGSNAPVAVFQTSASGDLTVLFRTVFTAGLANEGQVSPGDSGGGVFAGNRLVGLPLYLDDDRNSTLASQNPFSTDPNPAAGQPFVSAVFGNQSYFGSLFSYADEIAKITGIHPSMDGDANLDGVINAADFKIFNDNYQTGTAWTQGDFNLDGRVDFVDLQLLELNYGKTSTLATPGEAVFTTGVPEPGTVGVLGLGAIAVIVRRNRRA